MKHFDRWNEKEKKKTIITSNGSINMRMVH